MEQKKSKIFLHSLLLTVLLCSGLVSVQAFETEAQLQNARKELATLGKKLDSSESLTSRRQLKELKGRLLILRAQARDCLQESTTKLEGILARRDALAQAAAAGEGAEPDGFQKEFDADISREEQQSVACERIAQDAEDLFDRIQQQSQEALIARLFVRGVPTTEVAVEALADPYAWSRLISGLMDKGSGWERLSMSKRWIAFTVFLVLLGAGMFWRKYWFSQHPRHGNSQYFIAAVPWLLASTGTSLLLMLFLPVWPPALITQFVLGILSWVGVNIILNVWLANRQQEGLAERDAKSLFRWLKILTGLVIMGGLLFSAEAVIQLPEPHYFLLRTVMGWLLFAGLAWSALLLERVPGLSGTRTLCILMVLAALVIAISETLGFRIYSIYLLLAFSGTAAGFVFFRFVARSFVVLFDSLDEGHYQWQKSFRKWLDLESNEPVPGLIWLRLAISLLVWSTFAIWTLKIWGQSDRWLGEIVEYATLGFDAGSLHIAPANIIGAIAVLAIGISVTRWVKNRIISDLVKRTRLDRGGKEAMVTVSGYVGVIITLLIALGFAGISYTNMAIVAGALSVGIGFGLQNVVNNFVSGLILLFERPVRTGDWVIVGDTEGYVRKISIRSTQIETFDRADVIVPNSELISNKVSNLTLHDPWGRITVPVGVAYGSDIDKVIEVLLRVANEHKDVLTDQPEVSKPKALFRSFGDSALDFELRCFINQIDKIIDITSELNIAIDRAFREAGISIPFPQRDVYVKTLAVASGRDASKIKDIEPDDSDKKAP